MQSDDAQDKTIFHPVGDDLPGASTSPSEPVEAPASAPKTFKFFTSASAQANETNNGEPTEHRRYNRGRGAGTSRQRYQRDNQDIVVDENNPKDIKILSDVDVKPITGVLDVVQEGHGYIRPKFSPSSQDAYISQSQMRRFNLRPGDMIEGVARPPKERERYWGLLEVKTVNGKEADVNAQTKRTRFEELTAIYPNDRITLEHGKFPMSCRIIDLVAPIGKGQRAMVVSPPKAGKTTVMKDIAYGITTNFPDIHIIAALIGERPEEVTDIQRNVKGEVMASNFDEPPEEQCRIAEIAIERAKRLVEEGKDVVVLLDSITRLARAYNLTVPPSGRTLSGGFDPAALYPPKKFFGAARNCEEGGSLTIIATALIDTGSRMDELIYEEFKGTGNMELHLDRRLAEKRIFPAIDVDKSGTRREDLLFAPEVYSDIVTMRRMLSMLNDDERTDVFVDRLNRTETNKDFLATLKGWSSQPSSRVYSAQSSPPAWAGGF